MKTVSKILSLLLTTGILLSMLPMCFAESGNPETTIIRRIIDLNTWFPDGNRAEIADKLEKLRELNPEAQEKWARIIEFWNYANKDMTVNTEAMPDGLDFTGRLCIIVLGYELKQDGTMKDELLGRLEIARECAELYPDAYILCTGGISAECNVTESSVMIAWLKENGISENRLIAEDKSYNTAENAINARDILRENYPDVSSVIIVSSDYHIPWAVMLFESQFILADDPVHVVSNAGIPVANHPVINIPDWQRFGLLEIAEHEGWI